MNVLWLSHMVPYPPQAGHLQRSFNLIRQLASRHTLHLLAFNQKSLLPTDERVRESARALRKYCETVRVFPVASQRTRLAYYGLLLRNLVSRDPYSVQMMRSDAMRDAVLDTARRHMIGVVHTDAVELVPYAMLLPDTKKVLNHHNVESMLLKRRARMAGNPAARLYLHLQSAKLGTFEKRMIGRFNHNVTCSEPDRQLLLEMAPRLTASVIANGVDTDYFRPSSEPVDPASLLFVGNMAWFPNHDAVSHFMKDIWTGVRHALPDARLVLAGPGEGAIADYADRDGVQVTGLVDDVRPYLARATVVIIPIRVGGGTRLKILDALACGKAIVSTTIGCEGLDVTHEKNILIADSETDFVRQIARACADADLRVTLGREGRRLVETTYAWDLIGARLDSILREL